MVKSFFICGVKLHYLQLLIESKTEYPVINWLNLNNSFIFEWKNEFWRNGVT